MRKFIWSTAVLMAVWLLSGCGSSGGTISGTVSNYADGSDLSGVTVTIKSAGATANAQTLGTGSDGGATTGGDGSYSISNITYRENIVVLFSKDGYGKSTKVVTLSADHKEVEANIDLQKAEQKEFTPTQDNTLGVAGSPAGVVVGANTLVDGNGNPPSGKVTVSMTPIDTANNIELMPGDMLDEKGKAIESYGAMTVDFKDADGNALNLASGQSAMIRIPASTRGTAALPATIPFFYFDERKGAWVKEGSGTLKNGTSGQYYEGTVTHFTTWNCDDYYDRIYIKGCVENMDGTKVTSGRIDMSGVNYSGSAKTWIGSDGKFSVAAKKNAESMVTAKSGGKTSNTAKVSTGSEDKTLEECLIIGTAPLKAKLIWGKDPHDLDTHVIGPSNYHIYWTHKGSYSTTGAYLDVDDVTGYGPEVFSVRTFPEAGTYHYAVYNYSGTHSPNITNSPARVELFLDDGTRKVYTPPTGETNANRWWNVFDIVVGADKKVDHITPINTWTDRTDPVN